MIRLMACRSISAVRSSGFLAALLSLRTTQIPCNSGPSNSVDPSMKLKELFARTALPGGQGYLSANHLSRLIAPE